MDRGGTDGFRLIFREEGGGSDEVLGLIFGEEVWV